MGITSTQHFAIRHSLFRCSDERQPRTVITTTSSSKRYITKEKKPEQKTSGAMGVPRRTCTRARSYHVEPAVPLALVAFLEKENS